MAIALSKAIDLVFYARTIPWTYAVNSSSEHRASIEAGFQNIMDLLTGIRYPATSLFVCFYFRNVQVRKSDDGFIARLFFHFGIVKASAVNTRRRTSFKAVGFKT